MKYSETVTPNTEHFYLDISLTNNETFRHLQDYYVKKVLHSSITVKKTSKNVLGTA